MQKLKLNPDYKLLMLEYDFKYFLEKHIQESQYSNEDIQAIYNAYNTQKNLVKANLRKNKKQYYLWLNSAFIHQFDGGLLPTLFEINPEVKKHTIVDFEQYGIQWAYFEAWQKHQRFKHKSQKAWDVIVKIGSVLAFVLSAVKVFELFHL
jgi:hypothetical protein